MQERFLISRDLTGLWDKSRPEDKLSTLTSSFFAPIAQNPPSQSINLLGGSAYIDTSFVVLADQAVGFGTVGSNPAPPVTPNFYNVIFLSLNSAGVLVTTVGTEAATPGAVLPPPGGFPLGTLPLAKVTYQDNGTGGVGTILPLTPSSIEDVRPFFYGSYGKPTFFTDVVNDLKVNAFAVPVGKVTVEKGYVYFNSGQFGEILNQQTVDFTVPGPFYSPGMPAGFFNKGLLCVTIFGTLAVTWSDPAATANAVVDPEAPKDSSALALITIQDDGSATAGSILPIQAADVKDRRPFLNNFFGQIDVGNLSYCRVLADFPPDKKVSINEGVVYPKGNLINFPQTTIDFGSVGPYQFPASTPGRFRKALLGIDGVGAVYYAISPEALTPNAVVKPNIPTTIIPLAYVTMMDDGAGLAGSINPIEPDDIEEIRPFLGALGGGSSEVIIQREDLYADFLIQSYFRLAFCEDFTDTFYVGGATTAAVDAVVNNNCIIQPGQFLYSTNVFDSTYTEDGGQILDLQGMPAIILINTDTTAGLVIEGTCDGGANWELFTFNTVRDFTNSGVDLQLRFSNTGGGPITVYSYGVCYNDIPFPGDQPGSVPSRMAYVTDIHRMLRKHLTSIKDNAVVDTNRIIQLAKDVYSAGQGALNDTGTAVLPFALQKLLAPVKAVVGPNGTHADLQSAINFVSAGAMILVDTASLNLVAQVNVNKADLSIIGCGRGSVLNGTGAFVGLNITSQGVKVKGLKLNNFTTAVKVTAENCMITEDYFSNNTQDVDYGVVSAIVIEGNISE